MKTTYAYEFKLGRMGDAKSRSIDDQMVEVEVGAVGDGTYHHFRQLGGKGLVVAKPNAVNGHVVSLVMDQFEGLFPFYEKPWQDATRHFALAHLSRSLEAGLTPAQQANLSITHISTRPNVRAPMSHYIA